MPSTIVIALAFAGPLPVQSGGPTVAAPREPAELRQAYRDVMRQSARRAQPDYAVVVPQMTGLYVELAAADDFSHAERSRLRGCLKVRLEEIRDRLALEDHRQRGRVRVSAAERGRAANGAGDRELPSIGGPLDEPNARTLIELIQNTIAPESWQVNGGQGSIRYYSLYHALVVRQTAEVHHQLGGGLGQFRK
jgi:hypothetical protein